MNNIIVKPIADMSQKPVWSVMIPVYNSAHYLRETLESVLIQDMGVIEMEIWVVDDCSTKDNPQTVIEELANGRVKFYKQKTNVGQLKNFETCLNLARGQLIHLLHADDFVHEGFYKKLEQKILNDDNIGAAFTRHNFIDASSNILSSSDELLHRGGVLENFLYIIASRQVIQTPSIVVKRAVYEKLGAFNKELSWCEDWEMWIRIASNYQFYYEPEILASYRMHDNSNTGNSHRTGKFITDVLKAIKIYSSYIPLSSPVKRKIIKNAKDHFLQYSTTSAFQFKDKLNDRKTAFRILFKSFKLTYSITSFAKLSQSLIKTVMM